VLSLLSDRSSCWRTKLVGKATQAEPAGEQNFFVLPSARNATEDKGTELRFI
jgi:hypothetical protein